MQKVYAGPSNPKTGKQVYVGLERGSELGWSPVPVGYAVDYFKHIVFKDPNWDPKALNYDAHVAQAATGDNLIFDATNADLSAFTRRGGKLIMYQGWGEPGIPPANLVKYYGEIQTKTSDAKDAVRLFMVPGHGSLRRRQRRQHLRHGGAARSVGQRRQGASTGSRVARAQRRRRSHASAVRVSADCPVQRNRQPRRRGELRLRCEVNKTR